MMNHHLRRPLLHVQSTTVYAGWALPGTRHHFQRWIFLSSMCHSSLFLFKKQYFVVSVKWKWDIYENNLPITNWLTPWSWALLEKPPDGQLLKNFLKFYGTQRFITMFTRALHWSLSWARSIQAPNCDFVTFEKSPVFPDHVSERFCMSALSTFLPNSIEFSFRFWNEEFLLLEKCETQRVG
jgi:hypothetical protein